MLTHRTAREFWPEFRRLPREVRRAAIKSFRLLESDPAHRGAQFKPVGRYWSARASRGYRAMATREGNLVIWFWIGPHDEYERLIGRR